MIFEDEEVVAHRSGSGMMAVQGIPQTRANHVRIDFRGRKISMAEHGLHAAQIGPAIQKMRRKRMPQHMWRQVMKNAGFLPVCFDGGPERLPGHGAAPCGHK